MAGTNKTEIAAGIDISANVNDALGKIDQLGKGLSNVNTQLVDILKHFDDLNNKSLSKIKKQVNKYDLSSAPHVAVGKSGTMASSTGREKLFREYEQSMIDQTKAQTELTKEIKRDTAQRRKLRQQNADTEKQRVAKMEDKTSPTYLSNKTKIADAELLRSQARMLNAQNGMPGALKRNFKYQVAGALTSVGGKLEQTGTIGKIAGSVVSTVGQYLVSPAAGLRKTFEVLGDAIIDLGKKAVQAYSDIEATKTQLGVVFSTQTQAETMFGDISKYAVKSPFGIQQTSELAILLKQSGVYASDLMDTLRMLGDTAGGNMEKMKRIANNYAQIMSIGKASMLDMRQFAYAGIPIFEAVSKELGVSQQELRKLISDGKVTADIVEKVFKNLTGINGLFENATEVGAKTLKARLQNLSDAKQLALSSAGEYIVKAGAKTGNDSYANRIVTGIENIYTWLQEHVDTVNLQDDVSIIANRENRIATLESLIEYNKTWGTPDIVAGLEKMLEREKAKRDPDKDRATFVEAYNNSRGKLDEFYNSGEELIQLHDLEIKIREQEDKIRKMSLNSGKLGEGEKLGLTLANFANPAIGMIANHIAAQKFYETGHGTDTVQGAEEYLKYLKDMREAIIDSTKVQKEWTKAMKENTVLIAQENAADTTNKNADLSTSLNSSFNELASIYEGSEEYQKKEEERKLEVLKNAQAELKKIAEHTDTKGEIKFNEFNRTEFQRLNEAGAFTARQLNIVEGKNASQLTADRAQLESQFANASGKILEEIVNSRVGSDVMGREAAKAFEKSFMSLSGILDDKEFFSQFGTVLYDMQKTLQELAKYNPSSKDFFNDLASYLIQSTNSYEARTKGVDANLDEEKKKKGKEKPDYIPLWKRIIEGATGYSAERITTSKSFMEEYQKYAAMQVTRSGLQGLVGAGGRNGEIDSLMAYTDKTNKQGVKQIDWIKTEENLYKYALSMETPLKKASATMSGLAEGLKSQVDTYRKLTVDMRTVGEDWTTINNDIKGQYSVAQGLGNANILDNAFQATAGETKRFKVQFDEKQGLVVFDKISNSIVGAIDELKNADVTDKELKDYLENNVNVDNLVMALDKAAVATERNAAMAELNASMLSIANELEEKRLDKATDIYGNSAFLVGTLKKNGIVGSENFVTRDNGSKEYAATQMVNESFVKILKKLITIDADKLVEDKEIAKTFGADQDAINTLSIIKTGLEDLDFKNLNMENLDRIVQMLQFYFPNALQRIIDAANITAEQMEQDNVFAAADKTVRSSPLSIVDAFNSNALMSESNNIWQQGYVSSLGIPNTSFSDYSKELTKSILGNPSEHQDIIESYVQNIIKELKKKYKSEGLSGELLKDTLKSEENAIRGLADSEDWDGIQEHLSEIGSSEVWDTATQGANELAASLGQVGVSLQSVAKGLSDMLQNFASDLITSTMETLGESLAKGEDASKALTENLQNLTAGLLKNMGSMITQAGLSLAISSIGNPAGVLAGLAIAAAGGGLSFLGGYVGGLGKGENKEDKEYERLLKIKQDLTDLLKQAREDAIYYENTTRHKKSISANDELTQRSVHDAIITPSGDVITTDPKDYLIATKTPKTLVGGGAPTINFSVIDKSTGIKVTQQRSTYNEDDNSIDFEAIIESKVNEIIASPKGDEAFNARDARLKGRSVIA